MDASKTFEKKLETLKIELVSKLDQSNKSVETLIGTIKDTTGAYVSNADATRKIIINHGLHCGEKGEGINIPALLSEIQSLLKPPSTVLAEGETNNAFDGDVSRAQAAGNSSFPHETSFTDPSACLDVIEQLVEDPGVNWVNVNNNVNTAIENNLDPMFENLTNGFKVEDKESYKSQPLSAPTLSQHPGNTPLSYQKTGTALSIHSLACRQLPR